MTLSESTYLSKWHNVNVSRSVPQICVDCESKIELQFLDFDMFFCVICVRNYHHLSHRSIFKNYDKECLHHWKSLQRMIDI